MAGGFGAAALLRLLRRRRALDGAHGAATADDPAGELRRRLDEAREAADDRDEFDAAEGVPLDQVEPRASVEERRRVIHEQGQTTLENMRRHEPPPDA